MHILLGFALIVGLVAFAFGPRPAQVLVQVCACATVCVLIAFVAWLANEAWEVARPVRTEMQIQHLGKRGDLSTCLEWTNWRPIAPEYCKEWANK